MMSKKLGFLIFLILWCCIGDKKAQKNLVGYISSFKIDHVVKKRDWCRFPRLQLDVVLKNQTNDTMFIDLKSQTEYDFCKDSIASSNFLLYSLNQKKEYPLIILQNKDKQDKQTLLPNQRLEVTLQLVKKLTCLKLEHCIKEAENLMNSGYELKIYYLGSKMDSLTIEGTNSDLIWMLDDVIIDKNNFDSTILQESNYPQF